MAAPEVTINLDALKWGFDRGVASTKYEEIEIDGREFLLTPSSFQLTDLERYRKSPNAIAEHPKFVDVDSFSEYVGRFASEDSLFTASISSGDILAKLDYHGKDAPSWVKHSATLKATLTSEMKALLEADGKYFGPLEFAELLEEIGHIFISPDEAKLCEIALNIKGSSNARFESKVNRANGTVTFAYSEDQETGNVKFPESAEVLLRPFEGSTATSLTVLLRHRFDRNRSVMTFALKIPKLEQFRREAVDAIAKATSEAIGYPVLLTP